MRPPSETDIARVAIVTLGCGRNEVDSEQLAGLVAADGHVIVEDAESADVVLVNTCTFIAPATKESVDTVLAAVDLKSTGTARSVLVVGCMAERHGAELAEAIPEADAVVGFDAYPRLPELIRDALGGRLTTRLHGIGTSGATELAGAAPTGSVAAGSVAARSVAAGSGPVAGGLASRRGALPSLPLIAVGTGQDLLDRVPASGPRFPVRRRTTVDGRTTPWAYLKIASGCDRTCTFCAIPSFRGRFRSRPLDELVAEASWLAGEGVVELVLVSENTTAYGKDLEGGRDLQPRLLEALAAVEGIARLRLLYLQPAELTPTLVDAMLDLEAVAPYFDLSLQHAAAPVLTRMARRGDHERFLELIQGIRRRDPSAAFRSNLILGFPGETEDDVDVLERFLIEASIDWVGTFPFSPEQGTPAATMPDRVPDEVVRARLERIRSVQERIADAAARRHVGRRCTVLVELDDDGGVVGRSHREGPDGDGEVRLVDAQGRAPRLESGTLVAATVVATEGVDLIARVDDAADGPPS
ncbi:MAG: hypothetical protein RLZZ272_881 [Actinomycetota bacterium]